MGAFVLAHWRMALSLVIAAVLGAYILVLRAEVSHWELIYQKERTAFDSFTAQQKVLAAQQQAKIAADQAAQEKRNDQQTTALLNGLRSTELKLQWLREHPGTGADANRLPAAAVGSGAPGQAVCYDQAGLARALSGYRAAVLGLIAEGEDDGKVALSWLAWYQGVPR